MWELLLVALSTSRDQTVYMHGVPKDLQYAGLRNIM